MSADVQSGPARTAGSRRTMRLVLALVLAATIVAAAWPVSPSDATSAHPVRGPTHDAAARTPALPVPATVPARVASALPDRGAYMQVQVLRDPFTEPSPPPVRSASSQPAPSVPIPPPAPTVPWPFAGRLAVPGQAPAVLLHDGERTVVLPIGATLGDWRLDADQAGRLDFTHLPTGTPVAVTLPN